MNENGELIKQNTPNVQRVTEVTFWGRVSTFDHDTLVPSPCKYLSGSVIIQKA